ncbi:MAG: sphingomyelin phosphodiesterase [Dysgonamonadaceae bacterium]
MHIHLNIPDKQEEMAALKILNWNIYMLPYLSWFNGSIKRAELIGTLLKKKEYDILIFQEAFSDRCRHILTRHLQEKYPFRYGPVNPSHGTFRTNSGLWVLSRFPLKMLGSIQFREAKGLDWIAKKGAMLFEGQFDGSNFRLLTTHLQAHQYQATRNKQYEEVRQLMDRFRDKNPPLLICGDFNTDMLSQPEDYEHMLRVLDAVNSVADGQSQVTFDEVNNTLAKREGGRGEVLDYILSRRQSGFASIEPGLEEFYCGDPDFQSHLSDHYALEAIVRFLK